MKDETVPEVTPRQAAKALNVTPRTIFNYIKQGKLTSRKEVKGNRVFIPIDEIEKMRMKATIENEKSPKKFPEPPQADNEISSPGAETTIKFQYDPSKHLIVERNHYEGLLTKLGHYELEVKMLKDERPWWRRFWGK